MHRWSGRFLRALGVKVETDASDLRQLDEAGIWVSNHLSYLDILILGSQRPVVFISKSEVGAWPFLGSLVKCAGTIFLERRRRSDLLSANTAMQKVVEEGIPMVFFPEGTTTDGRQVRPFHAGLFEPAARHRWSILPSWIEYRHVDGSIAEAASYWGEMVFLPHFLTLLKQPPIVARLVIGKKVDPSLDRKVLAAEVRRSVVSLMPQR
jgi:1-acyl-sn-glycerol-3-phosphate acyltransferase